MNVVTDSAPQTGQDGEPDGGSANWRLGPDWHDPTRPREGGGRHRPGSISAIGRWQMNATSPTAEEVARVAPEPSPIPAPASDAAFLEDTDGFPLLPHPSDLTPLRFELDQAPELDVPAEIFGGRTTGDRARLAATSEVIALPGPATPTGGTPIGTDRPGECDADRDWEETPSGLAAIGLRPARSWLSPPFAGGWNRRSDTSAPRPSQESGSPERDRPPNGRRLTREPHVGLVAIVLLSLVSAFFAWVCAEPIWLTIGHSTSGTATVRSCDGTGVQRRCVASFVDTTGRGTVASVPLIGAAPRAAKAGEELRARMVSTAGRAAYADDASGVRAVVLAGLAMLALSGAFLAWAGGATRLPTRGGRIGAVALSVGAPLALLFAMLGIAW